MPNAGEVENNIGALGKIGVALGTGAVICLTSTPSLASRTLVVENLGGVGNV